MQANYIYLDHNATTPLDPRVLEAMMPYLTDMYGNASSSHKMGRQIKSAVDKARREIGDLIDVNEEDIYFTASATEAINIALKGFPFRERKANHIITVRTEHPAVLDTCKYLESTGVEVTYLPVDAEGLVDLDKLRNAFKDNTALVSVMHVNNETGVIQDVESIANLTHAQGALFMSDATQSVGKLSIEASSYIDVLAFSAHKFYGPKGIGGLYLNPRVKIGTLLHGGGHERGLRSGTLNVPGIVGMGAAAALSKSEIAEEKERIDKLRNLMEQELLSIEGAQLNGSRESRLYTTTNIRFDGVDNEGLLLNLKEICVSNGSACHSFAMEPSHVLLAMGLSKEEANSSIRFSLGRFNTDTEVIKTAEAVKNSVSRLRAMAF